jgi:hypothetical protein
MVLLGAWCGGVLVSRHVDPAQSRSAAMAEREWRPAQVASWRES